MEAFAIKGPDGDINIETAARSPERAWAAFLGDSPSAHAQAAFEAKGWSCVPVQITEGWIPVSELVEKTSRSGFKFNQWTTINIELPVGTKLYAEPTPLPKDGK